MMQEHAGVEMAERRREIDKLTIDLEELANQVRNLANKLEEHLNERDAHNPGVMRGKK